MDELEIISGSTVPFDIFIVTSNGIKEDLSGSTSAGLKILTSIGGTTILDRSTVSGNLSVDIQNGKLVVTITQLEADDLVPGVYIGSAYVMFPTPGRQVTKLFSVRVYPKVF